MKKAKSYPRIVGVVLAFMLAFGLMSTPILAAQDAPNGDYTVFISFEGFNLGHGFYIEPTPVRVTPGASAWDASSALLEEMGYEYTLNDWGFLDRIYGFHPGTPPNPPAYITIELEDGPQDGSIGSFDYTEYSGFQFTVNHTMADVGADSFVLSDGDVIRWQFTVQGWGADLGLGEDRGFWTEPLYDHADKTQLIRNMFADGVSEEDREAALAVIINPLATAEEVAAVLPEQEEYADDYEADYDEDYDEEYIDEDEEDEADVAEDTDEADDVDDTIEADDTQEATFQWVNPFVDVSGSDWFYYYVGVVFTEGLMTGTTADTFAPNADLSRAMAVTLLWRLGGSPANGSADAFEDVRAGRWYYNAVAWAYANDIVTAEASFAPRAGVTVEQFAAMLEAYAYTLGLESTDAQNIINVIFAVFTSGSTVTRGEAAAIMQSFIEIVM